MEISKALETIKAVCDDAVKNGRFRTIDETAAVTDAFNTLIMVSNAVAKSNQPQQVEAPLEEATLEEVASETPETQEA